MRFHVLSLPHTITRPDQSACAFTMKVLKFCEMMTQRGHTIQHQGHQDSQVVCTEHIAVTDNEVLKKTYGDLDFKKDFFKHNVSDLAQQTFNTNAIREIGKRKQKHDFLLLFWGQGHAPIMEAHKDLVAVEPGVGCHNKICTPFAVQESQAVMSAIQAKQDIQPKFYDAVIPNYFRKEDFSYQEHPQDQFVFVGRIIESKGIRLAIEITETIGAKLKVAGQGSLEYMYPNGVPNHVEIIGQVEPEARSALMGNAKALICPSQQNEPFGGVAVEAMMCGTPVISTDWGAFAETVLHGITGFRCRNVDQFVWALRNIHTLDRNVVRKWALDNYECGRIAEMYEEYFSSLRDVYTSKGFYEIHDDRTQLNWLTKKWPVAQ